MKEQKFESVDLDSALDKSNDQANELLWKITPLLQGSTRITILQLSGKLISSCLKERPKDLEKLDHFFNSLSFW